MAEMTNFILRAGLVAKLVLLILFILSLASWTIIFEKIRIFVKIKKESGRFLHLFHIETSWIDLYKISRELRFCPFSRIFRTFYNVLRTQKAPQASVAQHTSGFVPEHMALRSSMEIIIADEIPALERRLIFLATTVSISPFLGLLGTVWGIMTAFLNMGVQGTANITAVGPGIAEALITTVAGLAVAIPTVVAYNYFVDKLHRLETELENFVKELLVVAEEEDIK